MPDPNRIDATRRGVSGKLPATTGSVECTINKVHVSILEMEDVLFHLNSAVMMPARPSGQSSADGTADPGDAQTQELQDRYTGIKGLALVFRQIEFEPTHRMVVAGHTDTSGEDSMNFELSRLRADGVRCLLTGDREEWARISYGRHRVEDYQQVMLYFATERRWNTNPGPIDNVWGSKTKAATKEFFSQVGIAPAMAVAVGNNPSKSWPIQAWQAVYDLYIEELAGALGEDTDQFKARQPSIGSKFIDPRKMIVGCGESFPVDDTDRDNYRSQLNRRVEVLFFDKDDAPKLICPHQTRTKHTKEECPIWCDHHIKRNYIDPADFYGVDYHLQFKYFDRVKKQFQDVPGPIDFKAFKRNEAAGSAPEQIGCVSQYQNGVHTVRVRFGEEAPDFTGKLFYFEFEAPQRENQPIVRLIHTESQDATPRLVDQPADWNTKTFAQKYQYYDLPMKWSSHNYFTRHESTPANDERFHAHIKDKRELKPYGANVTARDQPLMFSFDDIVLFDASNTHDQNIQDANQRGAPKALCAGGANPGSRVKVFIVDDTTNHLKLWEKPNDDRTSLNAPLATAPVRRERIRLERNLISGMAPGAKVVHFRDGFYTVGDGRTTDRPANWMDRTGVQGVYVLGARIAVRDDPDRHKSWPMKFNNNEMGFTGDYELNYFHNLHLEDNHPVGFLIVYTAMNFMMDTRQDPGAPAWTGAAQNPGMADVTNFNDEGVYNAMETWNQKGYFFVEEPDAGDAYTIIKRFMFFDERETFAMPLAGGGAPVAVTLPTNIDWENLGKHKALFGPGTHFRTAQIRAFGGRVKLVAFICPDQSAVFPYGLAYAWPVRGLNRAQVGGGNFVLPFTLMKLNKSAYQFQTGIFAFDTPTYTEDGGDYGVFTLAHELGHVTSLQDEYVNTATSNIRGDSRSYPGISQHLIQYSIPKNDGAMMLHNGVPRLRHTWYHLHSLNAQIRAAGSPADHPLHGKKFLSRYKTPTRELTFKRHLGWDPSTAGTGAAVVKDDIRDAFIEEENFQLPCWVAVSVAPNFATLVAPLSNKVEADGSTLIWKHNAPMTTAERTTLRGIFAAAANKEKVNALHQLSQSARRLDISLYDCAQDESTEGASAPAKNACFHNNQANYRYHGVLVVRLKIGVFSGTPAMTPANVHARLRVLRNTWDQFGSKFRLTGGPPEMEKIFVHFMPSIEFSGSGITFNPNIASPSVAAFRSIINTHGASKQLSYCGVMTDPHFSSIIAASGLAGANRTKYIDEVSVLYRKTRTFHYCLNFIQSCSDSVTAAPTVSPAITALQPKFAHSAPNNTLTWIGGAAMTVAERNTLQAAYAGAPDKQAVEDLYQKTNMTSTNYCPEFSASVTQAQIKAHFLGVEQGTADLAALKFLQRWLNDKLRADGATPATYTLEAI